MALLSQFKFPSPFTRAYLNSPQLVQEALQSLNIGPFQSDGEFLCMCFLKPSEDPPSAEGLGSRPWEAFRRVLEDLGQHTDQTQSVINGDNGSWVWMRESLFPHRMQLTWNGVFWSIMEKVTCGKPSYTFTPREYGWEPHDREVWHSRHRPPPITELQLAKWRHWDLPNCGTWNQLPNRPLRRSCDNTGPIGSSAIWPLMHRKSQRWQQ